MARMKKKTSAKEELAAQAAIAEMEAEQEFDSPEDRDIQLSISEDNSLSDRQIDEKDIFAEAKKKFIARNTSGQFRIYRDGAWVGTKPSSYTWEKLRTDYGKKGGHFKVVAVDGDNQFAGSQSLEVAAIEVEEPVDTKDSNHNADLTMLELMKENQREAEAKAQSQQTGITAIMSSLMQSQAENNRMMMTMMQESNKQFQTLILSMNQKPVGPDPLLSLVTTLLTKKPDNDGFTTASVLKMIQDAETRAENRANRTQELIEKKADALSDIKAASMAGENEGEEKGLSGLIKGFVPVLTQVMQNHAQAQNLNAEQLAAQKIEEGRMLNGNGAGLNNGFVGDPASRPAIPAARPQQQRPRPEQRQPPAGATAANIPASGDLVGGTRNVSTLVAKTPEVLPPLAITTLEQVKESSQVQNGSGPAKEVIVNSRLKEAIFDMCVPDIGNAMLQLSPASKTAEIVLVKLEKEGYARQTVSKLFTLQDFYGYVDKFGLPEEAKPWLKEFYEAIQISTSQKPLGTARATVETSNGNGATTKPVAPSRSAETRRGPGTQPRTSAENT